MPEPKKRLKIVALHALLFIPMLFGIFYLTLAPKEWQGVDEAVVERIAREHGREAKGPVIDTDRGDLLLFLFLLAGAAAGFAAGYNWRRLVAEKTVDEHRSMKG